jgi:hypothetical protein
MKNMLDDQTLGEPLLLCARAALKCNAAALYWQSAMAFIPCLDLLSSAKSICHYREPPTLHTSPKKGEHKIPWSM